MIAYNKIELNNLEIVKAAKQWLQSNQIDKDQFSSINNEYPSRFYHPNFIVRILLFIASAVVLSAVTGLLVLAVMDSGEKVISVLSIIYGGITAFILDQVFIKKNNHYKSGITEALLYHSILFVMLGFIEFFEDTPEPYAVLALILFAFASFRYLDLISTVGFLLSLSLLIFLLMYRAGGISQSLIPIAMILIFSPLYFLFRSLEQKKEMEIWKNVLIVAQAVCLLLIYASGNYLVVRELSIEMLHLELGEGQDIPWAGLFYALTIIVPLLFLFFGITKKDLVLIRVSLGVVAFSVFTFKYYFSTGHHEITFTISGLLLLLISITLLRWLKTPRNGFTRENILSEKWANSNAQAFIVSQTLGAATPEEPHAGFGAGESGGGGAASTF